MSDANASEEWDVVVPEDAEALMAELRRHGVKPGQVVRMRSAVSGRHTSRGASSGTFTSQPSSGHFSGKTKTSGVRRSQPREGAASEQEPDYFGSFDSGKPDLAENSEEILRAHFPDR